MNGPNADPKDEVLARITEAEKHLAALDRQRVEVRGRLDALRAELLETRAAQLQIPQLPTCYGAPITAAEKVRLFRSLETCQAVGVPVAVERSRSGNGAHAWFFFASPVAAGCTWP